MHWSEWYSFFKQHFNQIPSLTKYHHFSFNADGRIFAKLFSNSAEILVHKEIAFNATKMLPLKKLNHQDSQHKGVGICMMKFDHYVLKNLRRIYSPQSQQCQNQRRPESIINKISKLK